MKVGRRTIEIGNPDKVLFPNAGITKRDLAEYYRDVAPTLLPHAEGRPISMQRFPDGLDGDSFYQKDVPDYFPDWIHTERIEKEGGSLRQVVIDDAATLVYLADQACITPHAWLSRVDRIRRPDRMVFDFDPPGNDWQETFDAVRWAARTTADLLRDVGLVPFLQTSGSKGLHIHVPLDREADFDAVRELARDLSGLLARRHPGRLTTEQRKAKRGDRVFLDVARNGYAQTTVLPYAVRARPGAPVATPLDWDELGRGDLDPRTYTVENVGRRLAQKDDPWKSMGRRARGIDGPREGLDEMIEIDGD
jgi:bifunctional non-homologous end joining protein LigD